MPSLGADMDEGTLLEWLVKPGDEVHRGDVIAVVDTAKAAIEVECFADGLVERLIVKPGRTVPVGAPLASIAPPTPAPAAATPPEGARPATCREPTEPTAPAHGEPEPPAPAIPEPAARPMTVPTPKAPPPARPQVVSPVIRHLAHQKGVDLAHVNGSGEGGAITRTDVERAASQERRFRASPLARRLARELGVDLAAVAGTGGHGIIRAEDVRLATRTTAAPEVAAPAALKRSPRPGVRPSKARPEQTAQERAGREEAMRQAIAKLMARSKREIPHYYLITTIDMGAAMTWMRERNKELPVAQRLVPAALLLKASALAAREVPQLNGFWVDDHFVPGDSVHLGVAVSMKSGGMVAPALHHAADLSLSELMAALRDLVTRVRGGRLRAADMTDATITVTNLGDQGVESVTGVIYPPQVALVGFGKVVERPWAIDGLLGVRPVVTASLAADHRATDGFTGSRYLETVSRLLQHPEEL